MTSLVRPQAVKKGLDLQPNMAASSPIADQYGLFLLNPLNGIKLEPGEGFPLDIVAVHGLNGNAYETWTDDNQCLWLRDILPRYLPGARVGLLAIQQMSSILRELVDFPITGEIYWKISNVRDMSPR